MSETLIVLSILSPVVLFAAFIFFGLWNYRKEQGRKYDFLTEFPYEMLGKKTAISRFVSSLLGAYLISLVLLCVFQISLFYQSSTLLPFIIVGGFLTLAYGIVTMFLSTLSASNEKAHLNLFVINAGFLVVNASMNGIFLWAASRGLTMEIASKILGTICFFAAVAAVLVMMNPKLKDWPLLENVAEPDGTVSFRRPRPFILAWSEWILLFVSLMVSVFAGIGNALLLF